MIAHVDMDAFFVSVELLRRPDLRGRPVVVATGTDPRARGVVMAASYEARRYGVHSALPLATAHRRCPEAVLLPRDMPLYRRASDAVMGVLRRFSDLVEVAGLDEAYLDLSPSLVPVARARELKRAVRERTRLTCSVGLAPNKLLAKIASDLEKPDGLTVLRPEEMLAAVGERPARILPGVGPKTAGKLSALGIRTVAELAAAEPSRIAAALGPSLGHALVERANGRDDRCLEGEREPKSESREMTFPADVADRRALLETIEGLASEVCARLREGGYEGRTVTLKIRLRPFRTHTRSRTLERPTSDAAVVRRTAAELLERFNPSDPVRLLGVGIAGLRRAGASDPAGAEARTEPLAPSLEP